MRRLVLILPLILALLPGSAAAHPHLWVEAKTVLKVRDGKLEALHLDWSFDVFFSSVLFLDFDLDENGTFSDDEVARMRAGAFEGLGDVFFFTDLRFDGEQVDWSGFDDFSVSVAENGGVTYHFSLALPEPQEIKAQGMTLSLYDPDYYVDVLPAADTPFQFEGLNDKACDFVVEEAADNLIYFDLVKPLRAVFDCGNVSG